MMILDSGLFVWATL